MAVPNLTDLRELARTNLPQYVQTIRQACDRVAAVLDGCATKCFIPTQDDFDNIKLVFREARGNDYARAVVQEYDIAARALFTANPQGLKKPQNRPQPCTVSTNARLGLQPTFTPTGTDRCFPDLQTKVTKATKDAICCDQLTLLPITIEFPTLGKQTYYSIAAFAAESIRDSRFIIGWANPKNTNLLTAIRWGLLGRADDANSFAVQLTLLYALAAAPFPVEWDVPLLSTIVEARDKLAELNLTLAQRQSFAKISGDIFAALNNRINQRAIATGTVPGMGPGTAIAPGTDPGTDPKNPPGKDWLTANWKSVAVVGGAGLLATLLIYFTHKTHN